VFPPPAAALAPPPLRKAVFVAGGMGINPLMSMLSFIGEQRDRWAGLEVRVLYSVRDPRHVLRNDSRVGGGGGDDDGERRVEASEILFLERIVGLFESGSVKGGLRLFLTGGTAPSSVQDGNTRGEKDVVRCNNGAKVPFLRRRMSVSDVEQAVGEDKEAAVVYICGVPLMTDQFVEALVSPAGLGMQQKRVLFEKWW
jgi:ferredoxin-NADP reductase